MPSDFFLPPEQSKGKDRRIYTVSELAQDIKLILEGTFGEIWVEGEVSNFRKYPSGHNYFSLKDNLAVLSAVIFARVAKDIKFKVEDGLKVICYGRISNYGPNSQYQIIVERIEPKGIGALQLALEQLKQRLEKEGLFAAAHKKPIPSLAARIGIVTSLQGAAIRDILKVLERRFKDAHIIINPVRVQGEGAGEEIARAIEELNSFNKEVPLRERIEALIVGRGGGSAEDLWAFNEEVVARAIYNSRIPVVSAVGHERDWTIADLVADVRAATPSVAAELVLPKKEDLRESLKQLSRSMERTYQDYILNFHDNIDDFRRRLLLDMGHILELNLTHFNAAVKKLSLLNPAAIISLHIGKIAELARSICVHTGHLVQMRQAAFMQVAERLSGLNPLSILSRGYSVTFKLPEEKVVKDSKEVKEKDLLKTRLYKGEIISLVQECRLHK